MLEIASLTSGDSLVTDTVESWELLLANLILDAHSGSLVTNTGKNEIQVIFKTNP